MKLFTAGYGNRAFNLFAALLRNANIDVVVDLRTKDSGSWSPDYAQPYIAKKMEQSGFEYMAFPQLGNTGGILGKRAYGESPAIRQARLRAYEDWIYTKQGMDTVRQLHKQLKEYAGKNICLMCCEKLAYKDGKINCHRAIVADALILVIEEETGSECEIVHL